MALPGLFSRIWRRTGFTWSSWRWKLATRWRQTLTLPTKQGRLTISCQDGFISRALFFDREYELTFASRVLALLRSRGLLPRGHGTFLDIGANLGVIAIGMLCRGEFRRAIAIEPEPQNFALLKHNVRQNGLQDRLLCRPYAISDRAATVPLELCSANFGDHRVRLNQRATVALPERFHEAGRRLIDVSAVRLDDLLATLPPEFTRDMGLVWIDTQGHEAQVLRGGPALFGRGLPVVAEVWPYGLKRAGVSQDQFCRLAQQYWSDYWMLRRDKLVRYPTAVLASLFDELGDEDDGHNILLTT
jgi:FkbM family methyltransferase